MNNLSPQRRLRAKVLAGGTLGLAGLVGIGVLAFPVIADGDQTMTKREEQNAELITVDDDPEGPDDDLDGAQLDTRSAVSRPSVQSRQSRVSRPSVQSRQSRVSRPSAQQSRVSRPSVQSRQSRVSRPSVQSRASAPSVDSRDSAPSRDSVDSRDSRDSRDDS